MTINVLPEFMLRLRAKQRHVLAWLLCLAPLGYLALFYSFVLRARLALGYWPQPYQPDPKELGFSIHYMATLLGLPLWMASPIAVLLMVIVWPRSERRHAAAPVLFFALTYLAAWLVLRADPGAFGYWFAD